MMSKPVLKIDFADFWEGFNKTDNYFWHLLEPKYHLEISKTPDVLIYSTFGKSFRKYNCYRIFYTGENIRPNFEECDFAFTFDLIEHPQHYRLPLYLMYDDVKKLTLFKDINQILTSKTDFCAFVVSNPDCKERIDFFKKLNAVKKVNSGGRILNNVGGAIDNKMMFIKEHKFVIAYENSSYPGYTTEKLFEAFLADAIPIYWGDPEVNLHFNPKRFLDRLNFESDEALIQEILRLDNDELSYKKMLEEPIFYENKVPNELEAEMILNRLVSVIEGSKQKPSIAITKPRNVVQEKLGDALELTELGCQVMVKNIKRMFMGKAK